MHLDPVIAIATRLAFAMLFGIALVHKVVGWSSFRSTLARYLSGLGARHVGLSKVLAVIVVGAEICAVAVCVLPASGAMAAATIGGLLLTYAGAMFANLKRGHVLLDCGCSWGSVRQPIRYALVARNIGLASLALLLLPPIAARPLQPIDVISVVTVAFTVAFLYAALNGLLNDSKYLVRNGQ